MSRLSSLADSLLGSRLNPAAFHLANLPANLRVDLLGNLLETRRLSLQVDLPVSLVVNPVRHRLNSRQGSLVVILVVSQAQSLVVCRVGNLALNPLAYQVPNLQVNLPVNPVADQLSPLVNHLGSRQSSQQENLA